MPIAKEDTEISTWFERDRAHVRLCVRDGDIIVQWWDGSVAEAVRDGDINPRDWHASAYAFALAQGLLEPGRPHLTVKPLPTGWAIEKPGAGVYCGWRNGGAPIWSSDITEKEAKKGAYVFDSEEEARETLDDEEVEDGRIAEVVLDIATRRNANPHRASFESCENAGLDAARAKTFEILPR